MNDFAGNYSFLIEKIDEFIRKYYLNKIVRGLIYLVSFFFLTFILVTTLAYYAQLNELVRGILFFSFLSANCFILLRSIVSPLLAYFKLGGRISHEQASAIIGTHFSPIKDKLLNTLQLKKMADENPVQRQLIEAGINQKIGELRLVSFSAAIRIRDNKKYLRYAIPPLVIILVIAIAAPSMLSEGTEHIVYYNKKFVKKAPFDFRILNRHLNPVEGEDFRLSVRLEGREIPQTVYLYDGKNRYKLDQKSIIEFNYVFRNIQTNKAIYFSADGYESQVYQLKVRKKPSLLDYSLKLHFPRYLRKGTQTLENSTDFTVPEGTVITWDLKTANAEHLNISDGSKTRQVRSLSKDHFSFSHKALKNISLLIKPVGPDASTAALPNRISVVKDLYPQIEVSAQPDSLNRRIIYAIGRLSDDHGFSSLHLKYRKSSKSKPGSPYKTVAIPFDKASVQTSFFYILRSEDLDVKPGDEVEYFFEVRDNDGINGAKASRSQIKTFSMESLRQLEGRIAKNTAEVGNQIEEADKKSAEVEKETEQFKRKLLETKGFSYEESKQLERLMNKQEDLHKLVNEIKRRNKENDFERKELLSDPVLQEKQQNLGKLFEELPDNQTRDLLKELEELLNQNKKGQMIEKLSSMQEDQRAFQKDLKRLLDLYKQLEFEQHLRLTVDKLHNLSDEQKALASRIIRKHADEPALQSEQSGLMSSFNSIKEDLKEAEEKDNAMSHRKQFQNPVQEQLAIENQQKKGYKSVEEGQLKDASESMLEAANGMRELAQKLNEVTKKNESSAQQISLLELRKILASLLRSSFQQEDIMLKFQKVSGNEPTFPTLIREQQYISTNLKTIKESLYSLSRKIPELRSPVDKELGLIDSQMKLTMGRLSERRVKEASGAQQHVMTAINNLVLFLTELEEQLQKRMQQQQSGQGSQKTLMQLSIMQERLNENMQKVRDQLKKQDAGTQQSKGKNSLSEQLLMMAREQQLIRQALQNINSELNKDGQKKLGNLDKLSKEMEQTEEDLVNKIIRQETIIRQEQILTKLLEAERADRDREWNAKRESKAAVDNMPSYNSSLEQFRRIKKSQTDLLQTVPASLNIFYQRKVGEYFKQLEAK